MGDKREAIKEKLLTYTLEATTIEDISNRIHVFKVFVEALRVETETPKNINQEG